MKPSQEALTGLPLFKSLDPESAREAADRLQAKHFGVGEVILRQGEWQGELHIIKSGLVSVTATDARGVSVELNRLGRGECFGEMSLLTGQPPSATVTAIADTDTWVLSHQDFVALMAGCPALAQNVSRIVSERLSTMSGKYVARHLAQTLVLHDPDASLDGSIICYNIAVSLARQTRRKVLLVEPPRDADCVVPCSQGLGNLADLIEDKSLLRAHEAPLDGNNGWCGLRVVKLAAAQQVDRLQPADMLAILSLLGPIYDCILVRSSPGADRARSLYESIREHADRLFVLVRYAELNRAADQLKSFESPPNAGQNGGIVVTFSPTGMTMSAAQGLGAGLGWKIEGILPVDATLTDRPGDVLFVLSNPAAPLTEAVDRLSRRLAKISVGLALGGGGAKGLAHIGVLKALEEEGVPIDYLAGSSFGAFVGALYAMGYESDELKKVIPGILTPAALKTFLWSSLLKFSLASLLGGKGVERGLKGVFAERQFKDLRVPFAIVAVDLKAGSEVVLTEGPVYMAVRASVSIPGIFPPLRSGDHYLVDGGVLNPLPTGTVSALGSDVVIGVDVSNPVPLAAWPGEAAKAGKASETMAPRHVVGILRRVVDIMQVDISQKGTEKAAVLIRPRFGPSSPYDFQRQEQFAVAGEKATREALPQLSTFLPWLGA